jgi:hypothetical protein
MNELLEHEECTLVCAGCGFLMAIPSSQLSDYYRAHGWFAAIGIALVLVRWVFVVA